MTPLLVAFCVILLDQASKEWVRGAFALHESVPVIPGFFDLTYIRNTGAAWGLFSGQNLALALLAFAMLVVLVVFRRKLLPPGTLHRVALGLLCGGIVGNFIDRLAYGQVVDFLDFHFGDYIYPTFNIADCGIVCGVTLYILINLRQPQPAKPDQAAPAP